VLVILITRFIGSESYGKLGFAMSLAAILTILTPLGLDQLMTREVARNKALTAKYLGNILVIELLLSVFAFAFITLAVIILRLTTVYAAVLYISGGYYILTIFSGALKTIFRAHEKMEYDALPTSIRIIVIVFIGSAVLLLGYGLLAIACAYLFAAAVDLALTVVIMLKCFVRPKLEIDLAFWKIAIPLAFPFGVLSVLSIIYSQIDVILIRSIKGDTAVGWYKAAIVLVYTFSVIPSILSSAIFPVMSRFHLSSKESLKFTVQKSVKYLMILGFPIATGIMLLAKPIITLLYGADFSPAVPALRILAFFIPFSFLNSILGVMLASVDKQRLRMSCYLAATIIRIALVLFLVFRLSLTGAAIAIVASEALLFALNYYFSAKHIPKLNLIRIMAKPLLASIGMAALVFFLEGMNLILLVILAAIAYFSLFFALKGFDAEDRAMMKDVWSGVKVKLAKNSVE
jgi:O-antigen/teichoic acid export membrane protein